MRGLSYVPRRGLSRLVGKLVQAERPKLWAAIVKKILISKFNIDGSEAQWPVEHYPSFGAFFARRLKVGARDFSGRGFLCPCDGKIEQWGKIVEGRLIQCKGRSYALATLLNDHDMAARYEGGLFITIYLAPYNYHRVHWASAGKMGTTRFVQGDFWPVNATSVEHVSELFCLNERYISELKLAKGCVSTVMVAATNVGNMELFHITTEQRRRLESAGGGMVDHRDQKEVVAGEEFGIFHMGSTVVMVLDREAAEGYNWDVAPLGVVKAGQVLAPSKA